MPVLEAIPTKNAGEMFSPADSELEQVIRIIISNYGGDTTAFYEDVRPRTEKEPSVTDESNAIHRFIKSA
ncbi:MAG: hypothetical protein JO015_16685 [Verrucomicrobia bacterium]|nr:hypothetical protein [Verrucomicrobiota bacterium]